MDNLYSKRGITIKKLAEKLLIYEIGDKIPKIEDLSKILNVGRGTVQDALKNLQQFDCIEIESKGHLGSFVKKKNFKKLLNFAGVEQINAVLPLPYSKKYEGIATGLSLE